MSSVLTLAVVVLVSAEVTPRHSDDRVDDVRRRRTADVAALVKQAGLSRPPTEVYLRVFKREAQLELWAGPRGKALSLVKTYAICAASGTLGPKRREGDLQVPEGLYDLTSFNPVSQFHLSMKVGYPNRSDRVRSDTAHTGGDIFIHGRCASIGCLALEDEPVEEVYLLAGDAGVRRVDIFPARDLEGLVREGGPHAAFWRELVPALTGFEPSRRPVPYRISAEGAYLPKGT